MQKTGQRIAIGSVVASYRAPWASAIQRLRAEMMTGEHATTLMRAER